MENNIENYKHSYSLENFDISYMKKVIEEYLKDKPKQETPIEKVFKDPYIQMSREEVLALKDGDECYIMSSWGMQKCTYPYLNADTHRNMFGGINKTTEELRDWGPIFKLNKIDNGK
jgi:hypothetical protein